MILVEEKGERDPQLLVIRQTDHAFLAGFLAREWGNEKFTKPQPNASFCLAVAEHDNGWSEWELQPTLDEKTRQPFSFMSIPTATHIALYQKGIERLVKVDPATQDCWPVCIVFVRPGARNHAGIFRKICEKKRKAISPTTSYNSCGCSSYWLESGSARQCGSQAVYGRAALSPPMWRDWKHWTACRCIFA